MILSTVQVLLLAGLGYVEYLLWSRTSSPTARGLSVLFATTIGWRIVALFFH